MTDEDVKAINSLVKNCKFRQMEMVCCLCVSPCKRVIDKGECPEIIKYLKKIDEEDRHVL